MAAVGVAATQRVAAPHFDSTKSLVRKVEAIRQRRLLNGSGGQAGAT